jgi:DNA-binding Xre family transcriptional regulator
MAPDNIILFDPANKLGTLIRAARKRSQRNALWLAQRLHMDLATLCRIERGSTRTINLATITEISRLLKSPIILKTAIQMITNSLPTMPDDAEVL